MFISAHPGRNPFHGPWELQANSLYPSKSSSSKHDSPEHLHMLGPLTQILHLPNTTMFGIYRLSMTLHKSLQRRRKKFARLQGPSCYLSGYTARGLFQINECMIISCKGKKLYYSFFPLPRCFSCICLTMNITSIVLSWIQSSKLHFIHPTYCRRCIPFASTHSYSTNHFHCLILELKCSVWVIDLAIHVDLVNQLTS